MDDARAIAVWCAPQGSPDEAARFEVHFNYWRLSTSDAGPSGATRQDFLDIGVQLLDPHSIGCVSIYLPFVPEKIEDLGPLFEQSGIAEGIFNELLDMSKPHGQKWFDFARVGQKSHVRVYRFDDDQADLEREPKDGGIILRIPGTAISSLQNGLQNECSAYFRIRAYMPKLPENVFVSVIRPLDRLLQSGFEELECIDFRFNDPRSLPDGIERRMRSEGTDRSPQLAKIAFLAAVPLASDLTLSHAEVHRIRRLETKFWNPYVPDGIPPEMIVYHWRQTDKDAPINDFSAFVKLRTRRSGRKTLFFYLAFAFAFGVLGNLAAWPIQSLLEWVGFLWSAYAWPWLTELLPPR